MTKLSDRYGAAAPAITRDAGGWAGDGYDVDSLPARMYAERPTVLELLGDVTGQDVLDLACGSGWYTRMVSDRGAAQVVGVDARAPLVERARSASRPGQRVGYHVLDPFDMPHLGWFDVVIAVCLLEHARSRAQLEALCRTVWSHLRPGGRFVGVLPNSDYDRRRPPDTRYGVTYDWAHDLYDGDDFAVNLHHVDPPLVLTCRYWRNDTYRKAMSAARLRQIEIRPWQPSPEALELFGEPFWRPWLDNPLSMALRCARPGPLGP
jgi:SAM-dependent methyltransferase